MSFMAGIPILTEPAAKLIYNHEEQSSSESEEVAAESDATVYAPSTEPSGPAVDRVAVAADGKSGAGIGFAATPVASPLSETYHLPTVISAYPEIGSVSYAANVPSDIMRYAAKWR